MLDFGCHAKQTNKCPTWWVWAHGERARTRPPPQGVRKDTLWMHAGFGDRPPCPTRCGRGVPVPQTWDLKLECGRLRVVTSILHVGGSVRRILTS